MGHRDDKESWSVLVTVVSVAPTEACNKLPPAISPRFLHHTAFVIVGNKNCAIFTHTHTHLHCTHKVTYIILSLTLIRPIRKYYRIGSVK